MRVAPAGNRTTGILDLNLKVGRMVSVRTRVLMGLGRSWPVRRWAMGKCAPWGVRVERVGDALELRKGTRSLRISAKHVFFAPEICQSFERFERVLPTREFEGSSVVDFAENPDALNLARQCLAFGAWIESKDGDVWLHKDKRAMILAQRHFIYVVDMAEKFELYFSPLVPEEREGLSVLDFSRPGIVQRYAKSGLEFEMASFPEEEEAIEEYFKWYRPKPGDLVYDMGAHCGVSTHALSRLVGMEGRVVCFEPDPGNFAILQRNIERHGLENVTALRAAISGQSGKLAFNAEGTIGSGLSSLLLRDSVGSTVMVDAMTIEEAFERFGTPAFCKIDIEGAELEAIGAAGGAIRRSGTHFALDTHHPQANGEMTSRKIEAMFREYGYEAASEANPLWTTWARPKS
jgi:FkbM family methyltransferase